MVISPIAVISAICCFILILFITGDVVSAIILSIIISAILNLVQQRGEEDKRKTDFLNRNALDIARQITNSHLDTLVRKRRLLVIIDDYGLTHEQKWTAEAEKFVDLVIIPSLNNNLETNRVNWGASPSKFRFIHEVLDQVKSAQQQRAHAFQVTFDPSMDPIEYEHFCAARLSGAGWKTKVTQASGDQGADIIATQGNDIMVVQCKLYSKPVGNAAVQEAVAAKAHYGCNKAMVISAAGFTKSAKALANSNGVMLFNHDDFPPIVSEESSSARETDIPPRTAMQPILPRGGWWQRTFGG